MALPLGEMLYLTLERPRVPMVHTTRRHPYLLIALLYASRKISSRVMSPPESPLRKVRPPSTRMPFRIKLSQSLPYSPDQSSCHESSHMIHRPDSTPTKVSVPDRNA